VRRHADVGNRSCTLREEGLVKPFALAAARSIRALYVATVVASVNRSRQRRGLPALDRTGRRQLLGLTITVGVVASCGALATTSPTAPAGVTSAATSAATAPTAHATLASGPQPQATTAAPPTAAASIPDGPGEAVKVSRTIDGDTFELTDGRTVRVLGIDSCESNTPSGREATAAAQDVLMSGGPVYLITEPGVTTDRDDRLLRYVNAGSRDLGTYMVRYDHTGVYQGDNDASAAYVAQLYANDLMHAANPPSGRECGEPDPPAPVPAPQVDTDDDDDRDRDRGGRFCGRFNPLC
jgi:endonuclease YncB( thermonuclease family)